MLHIHSFGIYHHKLLGWHVYLIFSLGCFCNHASDPGFQAKENVEEAFQPKIKVKGDFCS